MVIFTVGYGIKIKCEHIRTTFCYENARIFKKFVTRVFLAGTKDFGTLLLIYLTLELLNKLVTF